MPYKVQLIEKKDPLIQLETSKSSIKDLFTRKSCTHSNLFQISSYWKNLVKRYKQNEVEFSSVYFDSTTKVVINHKFDLDKSFQEFLYRIDNWNNESSKWIVESIKSQ